MRTRNEVQSAIDVTEQELHNARRNHAASAKLFQERDEQYLDTGSSKDRSARRDSEDEMNRCQVLSRRVQDKLDVLKIELSQIERAEKLSEYESSKATLASFGTTLGDHIQNFVEIDRQTDARVMALAVDVRTAIEVFRKAERLAIELRIESDFQSVPKVDLAECCLHVQRAVTECRSKENREPLAPLWLAQADTDWRVRGMSARDLADIPTTQRRNAVELAALQAKANGKPPTEPTTTTPTSEDTTA